MFWAWGCGWFLRGQELGAKGGGVDLLDGTNQRSRATPLYGYGDGIGIREQCFGFLMLVVCNEHLQCHRHISSASLLSAPPKRHIKPPLTWCSSAEQTKMSARILRNNPCKVRPTNHPFNRSSVVPAHATQTLHLHQPSNTRRLTPRTRSPASIHAAAPAPESCRNLVSIPSRIILRTNNQSPPLLRPTINRLDDINQLLLILQHPIQLIIISRSEIAHLSQRHRHH